MKNMMKKLAIGLVVVSVFHIDAKTSKISAHTIVKKVNEINEFFPGTWPLNKVRKSHIESLAEEWNITDYETKVPCGLFNENAGFFGNYPLADWIQLTATAVIKWVPAALIVRAVVKKMMHKNRKKKHHRCENCS